VVQASLAGLSLRERNVSEHTSWLGMGIAQRGNRRGGQQQQTSQNLRLLGRFSIHCHP
jgi:hypothetical protein